jgi:molybdopterin/thiamine biosynthesis adenylyltransferase
MPTRSSLPERPRTKPSLAPYRLRDGTILLARDVYGLGRSLLDDARGTIWRILERADGSRDRAALIEEIVRERPDLSPNAVRRALVRLFRLGVLEDAASAVPPEFSPEERERYGRNVEFFSLATVGGGRSGWDLQDALRRSRVTVLGVGGVGSATAQSLAAAGVGRLRVIDPDRVELSNLNRQLLFTARDVGRPKVDAVAERLQALNPHVQVETGRTRVTAPSDLPDLLVDCDVFVLGADRPHDILLWTNDAAFSRGTPWLENSYAGPRCALALFVPRRTPCLRCLHHHLELAEAALRWDGGIDLLPFDSANPVLGATAATAGHLGALQVLYRLTGLPCPVEGRLLQVNFWKPDDVRVVRPPFWPECPTCGAAVGPSPPAASIEQPVGGG